MLLVYTTLPVRTVSPQMTFCPHEYDSPPITVEGETPLRSHHDPAAASVSIRAQARSLPRH